MKRCAFPSSLDREDDGRWIAEALELPGVMAYGETREDAISNTERLAVEVIADRIKHDELPPSALNVSFQVLSEHRKMRLSPLFSQGFPHQLGVGRH